MEGLYPERLTAGCHGSPPDSRSYGCQTSDSTYSVGEVYHLLRDPYELKVSPERLTTELLREAA